MHPLFHLLEQGLKAPRWPTHANEGTILFHLLGLTEQRVLVELGRRGCHVRILDTNPSDNGNFDLTVFCDPPQLEAMMTDGEVSTLRVHGRRELLDLLAELVEPPSCILNLRAAMARTE